MSHYVKHLFSFDTEQQVGTLWNWVHL